MNIRPATTEDLPEIIRLVQKSFADEVFTDHDEHNLVKRLWTSPSALPQFTLVAESDHKLDLPTENSRDPQLNFQQNKQLAGFIQFSRLTVGNLNACALAPLAVLPAWQHHGIGSQLIEAAHAKIAQTNFDCSIVLGHANYYPKFGYQPADALQIFPPFEVPAEAFMVKVFRPFTLNEKTIVGYDPAFGI
ncbi:GNAT family N-acetyltransferase [Enterococcus timonensis]|uniref:GNAT family N-acetyltransferase n=1 Tax=Enterococcus timonensis TaxID=1852364 RepID=UPI0008DAA29F|nr:N-acetyltransferase [Enterococcus timonensis]